MSRKVTYYCDSCGKQRGEANHWWMTRATPGLSEIAVHRHYDSKETANVSSYCGQECLMKAISEWIQSQRSQL